jgi:hypothetical protein
MGEPMFWLTVGLYLSMAVALCSIPWKRLLFTRREAGVFPVTSRTA